MWPWGIHDGRTGLHATGWFFKPYFSFWVMGLLLFPSWGFGISVSWFWVFEFGAILRWFWILSFYSLLFYDMVYWCSCFFIFSMGKLCTFVSVLGLLGIYVYQSEMCDFVLYFLLVSGVSSCSDVLLHFQCLIMCKKMSTWI